MTSSIQATKMSTEPTTDPEQTATTTTTRIPPNLSSMPNEIKENIVYWVHMLSEDDIDCLNLDAQGESSKIEKFSSKKALASAPPVYGLDHWSDSSTSLSSISSSADSNDSKKKSCTTYDIKSLCLVDRTFYELCKPWLWERLDFEGYTIEKLETILTDIIPKHADHVRWIWWRISYLELSDSDDVFDEDEENSPAREKKWDPEKRSSILLKILQACTRVEELDIDLHPLSSSKSFVSPMHKFIEPVSKLKSLTALSLSAPGDQGPFAEDFLVSVLKELNLLETFTCSRISATTKSISPLGLCLSKLEHLSAIDLDDAECVDLSWSKLKWAGEIEKLGLEHCERVSVEVLYQLTKCFSSTLVELELDDTFIHHLILDGVPHSDDVILSKLLNGKYNFNLPKLDLLYVSIEILNSFEFPLTNFLECFTTDCKELSELAIGKSPGITKDFLEKLIRDKVWPKLKKLVVTRQPNFLSSADLEGLELYCHTMGIELEIDDDDDEEEDYDYDDEEDYDEDDIEFGQDELPDDYDDDGDDDDDDDLA